jgi:hypothetical protein
VQFQASSGCATDSNLYNGDMSKSSIEAKVRLDDETASEVESQARELGRSRERHLLFSIRAVSSWMGKLSAPDRARMDFVIRNPDLVDRERLLGLLRELTGN